VIVVVIRPVAETKYKNANYAYFGTRRLNVIVSFIFQLNFVVLINYA